MKPEHSAAIGILVVGVLSFALVTATGPSEAAGPEAARGVTKPAQASPQPEPEPPPEAADPLDCGVVLEGQHRGVCFAHSTRRGGYGSEASHDSLQELADIGVDWVSLTPFGWQTDSRSTEVVMRTGGDRGESDSRLQGATEQAHALGIRVAMKPHLWLRGGSWRGDIRFDSAVDWDAWFASYTTFIVHYAALSERLGIDMLVVGVELGGTTIAQPERWRRVIEAVRQSYSGPIVYAANWDEAHRVTFWDALDYIGVQMFAPLADSPSATPEQLLASANAHLSTYRTLSESWDRPILLTEVGFTSSVGSPMAPWVWPERGTTDASAADEAAQAAAYCAIIQTFGRADFVAGMYWWKWFSDVERQDGALGFSPRGKPAERVLRYAF